jgi:hypothetical protein
MKKMSSISVRHPYATCSRDVHQSTATRVSLDNLQLLWQSSVSFEQLDCDFHKQKDCLLCETHVFQSNAHCRAMADNTCYLSEQI